MKGRPESLWRATHPMGGFAALPGNIEVDVAIVGGGISGVTAAAMLGVGRAVGETMTVLMVTGNAAQIPHSLLVPVRTLTATIAAELGEAPQGGLHYEALFAIGIVLFVITFLINVIADVVNARYRRAD